MKTQRLRKMLGLMLMAGTSMSCTSDPGMPATCKDAKGQFNVSTDGPQTLYVGGDKTMPWSAFCAGMVSDSPKEFVELPRFSAQGNPANFSQFSEAPGVLGMAAVSPAFTVMTQYDKVRIDPVDLTIDITNKAFIRSQVTPAGADPVSAALDMAIGYMPYATAMECGDVGSVAGGGTGSGAPPDVLADANLDLTDLPFELAESQLCPGIGGSSVDPDPTQPTKVVNFHAHGTFTNDGVTCGRSSVRCLPDPTANGQVGGETAIRLRYIGAMARF